MRLITFKPARGGAPRLGVVLEGEHMQEMPSHPAFFTKVSTTVSGPYDPIPLHAGVTEKLDWEVELGVVIGMA